jgi:hypothetical protein
MLAITQLTRFIATCSATNTNHRIYHRLLRKMSTIFPEFTLLTLTSLASSALGSGDIDSGWVFQGESLLPCDERGVWLWFDSAGLWKPWFDRTGL